MSQRSIFFTFMFYFSLLFSGNSICQTVEKNQTVIINVSDTAICEGESILLNVDLPFLDSTDTVNVQVSDLLFSGLGYFDYDEESQTVFNYGNTYGLPGMVIYGNPAQQYGGIEATVRQISGGPQNFAGIAMAVIENSYDDVYPYNGPGSYVLAISDGEVKLYNGTWNTPANYADEHVAVASAPNLLVENANKLKLEIMPDAHVYGYVNDSLFIDYTIPDGIVPSGYFAFVSSNSHNEFSNIQSYYFPLEILWSHAVDNVHPIPDTSKQDTVPVNDLFFSGLGYFDFDEESQSVLNNGNTYGLPGMVIYGNPAHQYGGIEATVMQISGGPQNYAGIAMAVIKNSYNDNYPYNGPGSYVLAISTGEIKLYNGTWNTPSDYADEPVAIASAPGLIAENTNHLKLEIMPDAHIYGYVNDSLFIDYRIPDGIVPSGYFAMVSSNSYNEFSNIYSYVFPIEINYTDVSVLPQITAEPVETTIYKVTVTGISQVWTDSITIYVNPVIENEVLEVICDGENFQFGSQNLTAPGEYIETFETVQGCDSVVTMQLTVNPKWETVENRNICRGEEYKGWSESGSYEETLFSVDGCDSLVVTNLTVDPTYDDTLNVDICPGENYKDWMETGVYTEKLTSVSGCDSTVTTNLTVLPAFQPEVIVNGDTLHAEDDYQTYQWLDENGYISGANYKDFIIANSGVYRLEATDDFGCTGISEIVNAIFTPTHINSLKDFSFTIYPNPNNGNLTVSFNSNRDMKVEFALTNAVGQVIESGQLIFSAGIANEHFDLNQLAKGIYYLTIKSGDKNISEKIIIQ